MRSKLPASLFLSALLVVSPVLMAEQNDKVDLDCSSKFCFPLVREIGQYKVPLLGSKLFRYYLWKPYSIALYGPKEARSVEAILSDVPKRLVLVYRLDFTDKEIIDAADKLLRENPKVKFAELEPKLNEINRLYKPIKAGDSYTLEYEPGKGTTLLLNENPLGTVAGADFARDYFGIWLSEYPISESMRDELLGVG